MSQALDLKKLDLKEAVKNIPLAHGGTDFCYTCGLCSAVCPAKRFVDENYDPRKLIRMIVLGKEEELLKSDLIWLCLLCDTCTFYCPRGVKFSKVMPILRDMAIKKKYVNVNLVKKVAYNYLLPVRGLSECVTKFLKLYERPGFRSFLEQLGVLKILPESAKAIQKAVPPFLSTPMRKVLPERVSPDSKPVLKVAYFLGCATNLIYGNISEAVISVLVENGCEVIIPKDIECCGMPYLGFSDLTKAKELAKKNIAALERTGADFIVVDCATGGSFLREYANLLADDPGYAYRAKNISSKIRDISEVLISILGLRKKPKGKVEVKVTYHDPCHLLKAQGVREEPRELLKAIPGLEFVEMNEPDLCCGGAGTYNLFHYEESMKILNRKMENISNSKAKVLATGCPGCITQFRLGTVLKESDVKVVHPIELLKESYK